MVDYIEKAYRYGFVAGQRAALECMPQPGGDATLDTIRDQHAMRAYAGFRFGLNPLRKDPPYMQPGFYIDLVEKPTGGAICTNSLPMGPFATYEEAQEALARIAQENGRLAVIWFPDWESLDDAFLGGFADGVEDTVRKTPYGCQQ